jgi:tetratricopeptide (TPR) repeat protein
MKKAIYILSILCAISLWAETHAPHGTDAYQTYLENPSWDNLQSALQQYRQEMKEDTSAGIMYAYLCVNELEVALEKLQEAKETLSPRDLFSYANLLLHIQRYEEAVAIYDIINEKTPKWSCPWRHKGEALMKLHRLEEAEKATEMAIETRPDHFDAFIQLATIRKEMGQNQKALNALEKGLTYQDDEAEVNMTDVFFMQLELYEESGDQTKAEEVRAKLKISVPDDPRLR